jgi:hypothetical protein
MSEIDETQEGSGALVWLYEPTLDPRIAALLADFFDEVARAAASLEPSVLARCRSED